jgi:SAM-dependent methyltransferase
METWVYQEEYELEDRHWWFRSRRGVLWALVRRAQLPLRPRILDAGCGNGRNLVEFGCLGPAEGVDVSRQAVEFCGLRGLECVREAAIEELPFEDDRFDLLFATDVIEHVRDDGAALAELKRVATPGASLILTVPAYGWLWSPHDESHHHYRRYTRPQLRNRLSAHGWEPIFSTYFYSAFLPPVALVRTFQRLRSDGNGTSDLRRTPARLDRWLELPVRGEAQLIKRGVSLPAGVSLGAVCRLE